MKKFMIIAAVLVLLVVFGDILYWRVGWYVDFSPNAEVTAESRVSEGQICVRNADGEFEEIEIRGVNLGSSMPGSWAIDFETDQETYLRWFAYMQDMGANTIRVHTVMSEAFYSALYKYNITAETPLYLLQGVSIPDDVMSSRHDIYSKEFYDGFYDRCKLAVDVIHGIKKIPRGQIPGVGNGTYTRDVSQWVIGYVLGTNWDPKTVAYANDVYADDEHGAAYEGVYLKTSEEATPFEAMLASIGDSVLTYESKRYKEQRAFAFANSSETDPFTHTEAVRSDLSKIASLDVEHILSTDQVLSGQFASYHVYPYYPDYLHFYEDHEWESLGIGDKALYATEEGTTNTYRAYLQMLTNHHGMPVVIAEFGVPSSHGITQPDMNTGRDQGNLSEREQGEALVACYRDIMDAGCVGSILAAWHDEWYKNTSSSAKTIDVSRTAYWLNWGDPEQFMGLLAMEPGADGPICILDGSAADWTADDVVARGENGATLSAKYDEGYLYLCIQGSGLSVEEGVYYVPMDITPKSGSNYCAGHDVKFDREADFLLVIDGKDNTRLLVQERYEVLRVLHGQEVYGFNAYASDHIPAKNSPEFRRIRTLVQPRLRLGAEESELFELGLLSYGSTDPQNQDFYSLAGFYAGTDVVEIRIPWYLLNFYDPSLMRVHDDYYEVYGVNHTSVERIYLGVGDGTEAARIELSPLRMSAWVNNVGYHERLKESYYMMQSVWKED